MSVRYCSNCGVRIDPQDFESGSAVKDGANSYCATCALKFVPRRRPAGHPPGAPRYGHRHITRRQGLRPAKRLREPEAGEHEEDYPEPAAKKKQPVLLIGALVAAAVLLIIVIAVSASRSHNSYIETPVTEEQPSVKSVAAKPRIEEPRRTPVPEKSPTEKRLDDALAYASAHPQEFDKIVAMLEAIEHEEGLGGELDAQVRQYISEFMDRWDTAAKEIWSKAQREASAVEKSGDIAKAISIYESLPVVCAKHLTYSEDIKEEVKRLKTEMEAKSAFAQIEPLLAEADSAKGLEELKKKREQIAEFCAKYENTEYAAKLKEPLTKIDETIAELERKTYEEDQKKREEEERRKQEELAKQEAEKRAKEWQQQKAHLEKFWTLNNFDAGALPELQPGKSYRLFNGSDINGWHNPLTPDCKWTVQNGEIVGSNSSKDQSGLLITNYKRQYFWENYTLECKACVTRGAGAILVRANVDANKKFGGTVYPLNQNQWVSVKIVVKDDEVTISVDGGQPATHRGNTWQAGFVALAIEQGGEMRFKDFLLQLDSVKPAAK